VTEPNDWGDDTPARGTAAVPAATTDPHRRRLDAIAGNAVAPALDAIPAPDTGERWWLPLGVREHIGRAVAQALLDAGAVTIAIVPDGTRKTVDRITDAELTALYDEIDQLDHDISAERLHNDDTCEAVQARDVAEAAVQRARDLHHLAHLYEIDCPCPAPPYEHDEHDDAFDAYWERHSTDDDGDVACLDRPVADICPTCLTREGDPHSWPCPTALALDTPPEPAATETAGPLVQHW